jgi:hypothetical protein
MLVVRCYADSATSPSGGLSGVNVTPVSGLILQHNQCKGVDTIIMQSKQESIRKWWNDARKMAWKLVQDKQIHSCTI